MKLKKKIEKAKEILESAHNNFGNKAALAWTGGKDSTLILHLVRETFGNNPFQVFFNDSTMEFPQVYDFVARLKKDWNLDVVKIKHLEDELKKFHATDDIEKKKELSRTMKISALNYALDKYKWQALITGIRRDEHVSRSKEKHFSKRDNHIRIHPILHFTEKDVWDYIKTFNVPYVSLYDEGYRSLGEVAFTKPAIKGKGERSGRDHDKEIVMERLRALGYY